MRDLATVELLGRVRQLSSSNYAQGEQLASRQLCSTAQCSMPEDLQTFSQMGFYHPSEASTIPRNPNASTALQRADSHITHNAISSNKHLL